jgi:hypothetical protein
MPGGRVPKYTRNDPGNKPDKGLEGGGQHHIAQPAPTPKPVGPASIAGMEKFEQPVSYAAIRANKAGSSLHSGAPDDGGPPGDFSSVKDSRGIVEQAGMFSAAAGNSPKRSAGKTTPTDMATRRKLSTAEGG